MEYNNSFRTRYKKVASLKPTDYRQVGQYVQFANRDNLSRLLVKHRAVEIHLHGDHVNERFNRAHHAKKTGVLLPNEPQQVRMLVGDIPTQNLEAIKRIVDHEMRIRG